MSRQRLYLHVGLPKSGTTFLQWLLAYNRDPLKEHGFVFPYVRDETMFYAAVELRGDERGWGLDPESVRGTWDSVLDRVREFGGTGIVSHELLAGARPAAVEQVARDTADFEVHVVVTARDVARHVNAQWQEEVKNGRAVTYEGFRARLMERWALDPEERSKVGFWRAQDLAGVLDRWGSLTTDPSHVHVVPVPHSGKDRFELWRRFAGAMGLDPECLEVTEGYKSNESLGTPQVALLRQVLDSLDGRLVQPHYSHVVKRFFAQRQLGQLPGPRAVTPPDFRVELEEIARGWVAEVQERGYDVHGPVEELLPVPGPEGSRHPDDVTAEELVEGLPDVLAAMLVEIATLRGQITGPRALPPLPGTEVADPDPPPSSMLHKARRLASRAASRARPRD